MTKVKYKILPDEVFEIIGTDTRSDLVCIRFVDCKRLAIWASPKDLITIKE